MQPINSIYLKIYKKEPLSFFKQYNEIQWMSPEAVKLDQFERIKQLLEYSFAHVSYYRDLFNKIGMIPQDIKSFDDMKLIPILTKSIIKSNINDMISNSFSSEQLVKNTSGGSTGEPLTFFQNRQLYLNMEANGFLSNVMAGWTGKEPFFNFWGNPREFKKKKSFIAVLKERLTGNYFFNSYNYNEDTVTDWVKLIQKEKEIFLYGYTTVLADIARFIERKQFRITSVKGVLTTAEKLYSWQRDLIEKSFCARVYDQYGSREIPGMASECEHGKMHQLTPSAYLEFEDDPTVTNGSKKVLATCLTNYAMPFIRYEIGDYARPLDGLCSCGRGLPMMEMDIGRTTDCIVTPEGNTVYGTFFVRQMYGQDRVQNFQFHQTSPAVVDLYVVRSDGFTEDDASRLQKIRGTIREQVSLSMDIQIHFVDTIPRTLGGKHRFVVSDVVR